MIIAELGYIINPSCLLFDFAIYILTNKYYFKLQYSNHQTQSNTRRRNYKLHYFVYRILNCFVTVISSTSLDVLSAVTNTEKRSVYLYIHITHIQYNTFSVAWFVTTDSQNSITKNQRMITIIIIQLQHRVLLARGAVVD